MICLVQNVNTEEQLANFSYPVYGRNATSITFKNYFYRIDYARLFDPFSFVFLPSNPPQHDTADDQPDGNDGPAHE